MKLEKQTQLKSQRFTYQVRGTFHVTPVSIIYKAKMIGDNEQEASEVVIKQTSKIFGDGQEEMSRMIQDLAMKEINTLKNIKNKNVVGYIDDFENDHSVYLVMEFCNSLDLGVLLKSKTNLKKHKAFVELEAIGIIKQILNGLKGLHQNLVIHRNLEISNILVQNPGTIIKLTGLKRCQQRAKIDNNYDSLDTIAPEVILNQKYGLSVDIFAVGCLLYQLIFGKLPFPTNSKEEYIKAIKDEQISWDSQISMSPECKKLIQNMLKFNPNERITFVQIYSHPFFQRIQSTIGVSIYYLQEEVDQNETQKYYNENSKKIDEDLEQLHEKEDQITKLIFPQLELLFSMQKISQEDGSYELIPNDNSQNECPQQNQLLDDLCKQLNIIYFFNNTFLEINSLILNKSQTIQLILLKKSQQELKRLIQEQDNQQNQQLQILQSHMQDLMKIIEEYLKQFVNQNIDTDLDKMLYDLGLKFMNHFTIFFRYHKHLFECIKNVDVKISKFEPNLQLEFNPQELYNEVNFENLSREIEKFKGSLQ